MLFDTFQLTTCAARFMMIMQSMLRVTCLEGGACLISPACMLQTALKEAPAAGVPHCSRSLYNC
jgi:hypothetical protein